MNSKNGKICTGINGRDGEGGYKRDKSCSDDK